MKHFEKITNLNAQFEVPEEHAMTPLPYDASYLGKPVVSDAVWEIVSRQVEKHAPVDCCPMNDVTVGFDLTTVWVEFFNWESREELELSLDWVEEQVQVAYREVCEKYNLVIKA